MIRNAVLHLLNEQPLVADLPAAPAPGDTALICTNLRTIDGKRPFFVDSSASIFVFPLTQLRFVEVPSASPSGTRAAEPTVAEQSASPARPASPASHEPPAPPAGSSLPATVPADFSPPETEDLELDEDLLRRVREL